ncbi:MAG: FAD-dependent oxidoreductase [Alphaproteobacteria bacterium]
MAQDVKADLCVIGAGSGGLAVAAGAAQMGANCVLIEKGKMGGDCLNYGCVPSKALLAAAHTAATIRDAGRFGIAVRQPEVDFARVMDHVHGVIAAIAPHDSVERFEGLGVRVIQAQGRFTAPDRVEAGGDVIRARRFVIATGSGPLVPPIPGIDQVAYETNETLFDRRQPFEHLLVMGGGPIGIELAQAHRRLGARVTVVEMASILNLDDPELVGIVRDRLAEDGIDIHENAKITGVEKSGGGVVLTVEKGSEVIRIEGSGLLVAAGRVPNVNDLGLEAAGVAYSRHGIEVDARLRTTAKHIFAIGDVAGGPQFTHVAGYHAGIVIRNALFRLPAKADHGAVPHVTYTMPELAAVGLGAIEARDRHGDIRILRFALAENDRARAERASDGLIKVIATAKGRILGAGIAAPHAGELILPWVLAVAKKLCVKDMANVIAPYPTLGEISKRAAGSFYTQKLFGEGTRRLVRLLAKLG